MYKKNTSAWLKHWDFILLDLLCMEAAFWMAVLIRNGLSEQTHFPVYTHASTALILINITVVFFIESYKSVLKRDTWDELGAAFAHVTCIVGAMLVYIYMMQESYDYSRTVYVLFWFLYLLLTMCGRMSLKSFLFTKRRANKGNRSLLVVAWKSNAREVMKRVYEGTIGDIKIAGIALVDAGSEDEEDNYDVEKEDAKADSKDGPQEDYGDHDLHRIMGFPVVACGTEILPYVKENWIDEVFFCPPMGEETPSELLEDCRIMGITTHSKVADSTAPGMIRSVEKLSGYTVLTESIRMTTPTQAFLKRMMDIVGSLVGLLITGIAFIFVAPAIKIKSPGPVFFSQTRVGKNGRMFKIYKFRSMYMDAEERKKELMASNECKDGMMFKIDNDPRIIQGVGQFIRKTSIDELPQFWNVLKGDMSLVGTRPPTIDEWKKYELHHRRRLAVRPGITGMWQVSGRSNIRDFEEVVRLDTKYIQEWTIGLDIKILFETIAVVAKRKGAS
ncbi:MAG: sugar transferase [Clostridiales bacterium]|nr:sugar transferase [Clostridiales bacterium]